MWTPAGLSQPLLGSTSPMLHSKLLLVKKSSLILPELIIPYPPSMVPNSVYGLAANSLLPKATLISLWSLKTTISWLPVFREKISKRFWVVKQLQVKLFLDFLDHSKVGIAGWSRAILTRMMVRRKITRVRRKGHIRNLFTYVLEAPLWAGLQSQMSFNCTCSYDFSLIFTTYNISANIAH